jgi:hypothetical protein
MYDLHVPPPLSSPASLLLPAAGAASTSTTMVALLLLALPGVYIHSYTMCKHIDILTHALTTLLISIIRSNSIIMVALLLLLLAQLSANPLFVVLHHWVSLYLCIHVHISINKWVSMDESMKAGKRQLTLTIP